jgi:hypothetical protein
VGDAIDSFNINKAYFDHFGVKVLGAVFNKVEDPFEDIKEHGTAPTSVSPWTSWLSESHHLWLLLPIISDALFRADVPGSERLRVHPARGPPCPQRRDQKRYIDNDDFLQRTRFFSRHDSLSLRPARCLTEEKGACQRETPVTLAISDEEKARAEAVIDAFVERVDVAKIVHDVHASK